MSTHNSTYKRRSRWHVALVAIALVIGNCGTALVETAGNGGGMETTNGFVATITYPSGLPAAHAVVRVRHRDYLSDTSAGAAKKLTSRNDVLTDDSGRFAIDSLDTGAYLIEAVDANGNAAVISCTVFGDSLIDLGSRTLVPMGTITGTVSIQTGQAFTRIRGLERCARTDSAGVCAVQVPAGATYTVTVSTSDTTADLPMTQPVQSSRTVEIKVDLRTYRSDSLAVRALLDEAGLMGVSVTAVQEIDNASRRITGLNLSHQNLSVLPASIGKLTFLWSLNVGNNPIADVPVTLANLPYLTNLTLDSAGCTALPASISGCISLKFLSVNSNRLSGLPLSLSNLKVLRALWLADNLLDSVPRAVCLMDSLEGLRLERNNLSVIPAALCSVTTLRELHIDGNNLDSLPGQIGELINLQAFYAYDNKFTSLPQSLSKLVNLTVLNLQGNLLSALPDSIGNLTSLNTLFLSSNQLTTLPGSVVNISPSTLYLFGNRLCTLPANIAVWADAHAESGWLGTQVCP